MDAALILLSLACQFVCLQLSFSLKTGSVVQDGIMKTKDLMQRHCCSLTMPDNCSSLCIEAFGTSSSFQPELRLQFDQDCVKKAKGMLRQCIRDVEEPCQIGCPHADFCRAFVERDAATMFRRCSAAADFAARRVFANLRSRGYLNMSSSNSRIRLALHDGSECLQLSKDYVCAFLLQPCHSLTHGNALCGSECLSFLRTCADAVDVTTVGIENICEYYEALGSDDECVSLKRKAGQISSRSLAKRLNPCATVHCPHGQHCFPNLECAFTTNKNCSLFICKPACLLLDQFSRAGTNVDSQKRMPAGSAVILSRSAWPDLDCDHVCYCLADALHSGWRFMDCTKQCFEKVANVSCLSASNAPVEVGQLIAQNCSICRCNSTSSQLQCSLRRCSSTFSVHSVYAPRLQALVYSVPVEDFAGEMDENAMLLLWSQAFQNLLSTAVCGISLRWSDQQLINVDLYPLLDASAAVSVCNAEAARLFYMINTSTPRIKSDAVLSNVLQVDLFLRSVAAKLLPSDIAVYGLCCLLSIILFLGY